MKTGPTARLERARAIATSIDGLCLRPWNEGDLESLVRHGNNRAVWRNLTDLFPHPYTRADARAWVRDAADAAPSLFVAIDWRGEAVGGAGVIAGEGHAVHTGQFGYWLGESHWGHGLATASARALKEHLFLLPRFERLEAPVFAWNPASMRVLEKAGFTREGVLRRSMLKDGQLIDQVMYAAVKEA